MSKASSGHVVAALRQQVEIIDNGRISLDSLWRAAGRPAGKDPKSWAELASPLISGFADYFSRLSRGVGRTVDKGPLLWQWDAEDSDPWRTGDLMSVSDVAQIYAAFLEAEA